MQVAILVVMICVVFYAFFAKRLSSTIVTAPIIFLGLGYLISLSGFMATANSEALLHLVAETALIILLFADASQTDFCGPQEKAFMASTYAASWFTSGYCLRNGRCKFTVS